MSVEEQKNNENESVSMEVALKTQEFSKTKVEITVPKYTLKYKIQPKLMAENIVFLNAQDPAFYRERKLSNPLLKVWCLRISDELNYPTKRLIEAAYSMNIQLTIRETHKFDLVVSQDGLETIYYDGVLVKEWPEAVLPRIGAKIDYFSLAVVRQIQKMNILLLNDLSSLEISKDKLKTLQTLGAANLPIPKTMIAKFPFQYESIAKEFQYPLILKKSSGSQGKGVLLVQSEQHLKDIEGMLETKHPLIFQEFIKSSTGKDIRVVVVGGKALGAMMRMANSGYKSNFHQGGSVKRINLSNAVEWLAIDAAKQIGLDIAGIDLLIGSDTYKICEVNSSPGFEGFETATGIDVPKQIMEYIIVRCGVWSRKFKKNKKNVNGIPIMAEHIIVNNEEPNQSKSIVEEKKVEDILKIELKKDEPKEEQLTIPQQVCTKQEN
jgi:gamma-F420-2:alpha-L-glutamate ligase